MRRKHRKRRHRTHQQRLRNSRREQLSKEENTTFRFATSLEELALEAAIALRDEGAGARRVR